MMKIALFIASLVLVTSPTFAADNAVIAKGKAIYEKNCIACHGKNGEGRAPVFPPLAKSDYFFQKPNILISAIIKGINNPIKVNGKNYNGFMPATALNDADVAALSTYIMNTFNNGGGMVTDKDVKLIRAKK